MESIQGHHSPLSMKSAVWVMKLKKLFQWLGNAVCILSCTRMIHEFGLVLLSPSPASDVAPAGHHQSIYALTFGILVLISFEEG